MTWAAASEALTRAEVDDQGESVRFNRLADLVSLRHALVESATLALGGTLVAVILTQHSYEATVQFDPVGLSAVDLNPLLDAARSADADGRDGTSIQLGVTYFRPHQARVVCRSEDAGQAEKACRQLAQVTAKQTHAREITVVPPSSGGAENAPYFVAPLLALVWCAFRLYQRRRSLHAQAQLGEWSVVEDRDTDVDVTPQIAPSFRAPASKARHKRTVPGMAVMPVSLENVETEAAFEDSGASPVTGSPAQPSAASQHVSSGEKTTDPNIRVVYRVGGNPFRPDRSVLTPRTLTQLEELCVSLSSDAERYRVVRVASDLGSRYAKTQTSVQLACALAARDDTKVLLLEADSDSPALHKALRTEAPMGLGFSEQMQRILERNGSRSLSVMRFEGNLHALIESRVSTPASLGLSHFSDVLQQLRQAYDFIVVDGPVLDVWPDAAHLAQHVDSVLLVTAASTRANDPLALAARHFPPENVLGVLSAGNWSASA